MLSVYEVETKDKKTNRRYIYKVLAEDGSAAYDAIIEYTTEHIPLKITARKEEVKPIIMEIKGEVSKSPDLHLVTVDNVIKVDFNMKRRIG